MSVYHKDAPYIMEHWTDELLNLYLFYLGKRLNPEREAGRQGDREIVSDDVFLSKMGIEIQKAGE